MTDRKGNQFSDIIKTLTSDEKQELNDYILTGQKKVNEEKDFKLTIKIENLTAKEKLLMMESINKIAKKNNVEVKFMIE